MIFLKNYVQKVTMKYNLKKILLSNRKKNQQIEFNY
jgi:hypothetical protein